MNGQHLRTFIWLRWRLFIHQLQRAGIGNAVILAILGVFVLLGVVFFSVVSFAGGLFFVQETPPDRVPAVVMYVWDAMVVFFLFIWGTALLAELQRSEALSFDKFLHLPVSLGGVFLLNYLSSLACFTMAALLPIMVGFSLGACFSIGPAMLLVLPLLAAFMLMVTALSYQFQGWLASLMINKRRRRNMIVAATFGLVILCQLPNMINLMGFWDRPKNGPQNQDKEREHQIFDEIKQTVSLVNIVLPPGWLPLGAMAAAEGNILPALLGTLGMTLIGSASLWRAYRTIVRLYTGQFTAGNAKERSASVSAGSPGEAAVRGKPKVAAVAAGNMLEKRLPWISEQAAVVALGGLRSLMRAPETKMLLLTPLILVVMFGFIFFRSKINMPDFARPFIGFGILTMSLVSMIGFVGNQFAFDRGGFRIYVLSPAPRRDILLGKNLAMMPLAVTLSIVPMIALQFLFPMSAEYFLAVPAQFLSMYLLFCMLANWLSMFAPMPIPTGSVKPTKIALVPVLLQILCVFLLPAVLAPAILPIGIDYWLHDNWEHGVYLLSTLIVCLAVVLSYRLMLTWQGWVLQSFELWILQTVTTKAE